MNALLDFIGEHWLQTAAAIWLAGFGVILALVYVGARGDRC